mgnify:CR=1 FL=1|jgi:acyl-CoA thioester hydrolase
MVNDAADRPQCGRLIEGVHRFPVRVYFEDTDFTGVVYHANYLRFMERARSDMLRVAGVDQRAAFEQGEGYYAVAGLDIRFRRPARIDDELLVISRVAELRAASVLVHQRVMRGDEVVTEADVNVAFLGQDGRPRRQPAEWRAIFGSLTGVE